MRERITVRLPPDLLVRAKHMAAAEGRTLTSLIEQGLRAVVESDTPKSAKRQRVALPVSKATGGLLPGIDLRRFADCQDREDLEHIERMKRFK
jgi:hypothetical protein